MAEVMPMCTLCAADEHEAPQRGCPGRNATGPQRIRWNWNAKYRKARNTIAIPVPPPIFILLDDAWIEIGTLADEINTALPSCGDPKRIVGNAHIRLNASFELFDPDVWRRLFYRDVDLDAIDWADEMRKLPGQFTQRLCFPGSPDQRIIAEGVYELTGATAWPK